jgi:hypothetical protein
VWQEELWSRRLRMVKEMKKREDFDKAGAGVKEDKGQ